MKAEIHAKGSALKDLLQSPGWLVLKELMEKSVLAEGYIDSIELGSLSDTAIGKEVKLRKKFQNRLRIFFDNVIGLVEKNDTLNLVEGLQKPSSLFHRVNE
jgi:hypothetical protein